MSFRREEKVEISPTAVPGFLAWVSSVDGVNLFPRRRVISIYLDTEHLEMYHDSAEGVLPRRKVRLRRYRSDDGGYSDWRLETKISSVEGRFKTSADVSGLDMEKLRFLDGSYGSCRPSVEVVYDRAYLWVRGCRVTVDTELRYRTRRMETPVGARRNLAKCDTAAVVEVKTDLGATEDVLLEKFPWERARFSKYCRAVESVLLGG